MVGWLVTPSRADGTFCLSYVVKTREMAQEVLSDVHNENVQYCDYGEMIRPLAEHLIATYQARYSLYCRKNYWDWRHRDHVQYHARVQELYELSKTKPVRIEF